MYDTYRISAITSPSVSDPLKGCCVGYPCLILREGVVPQDDGDWGFLSFSCFRAEAEAEAKGFETTLLIICMHSWTQIVVLIN